MEWPCGGARGYPPRMDAPRLPPVVAGRSALPAFLAVEAWAREKSAGAREAAEATRADAEADAARIRREGDEALKQAVVDGEREALRDVESQQRDKVSEARRAVEAWIGTAEEAAERAIPGALDLLCTDGGSSAGKGSEGN